METPSSLCLACNHVLFGEIKEAHVSGVLVEHNPACCLLCRLISSARTFVSSRNSAPLKSFAVQFLQLVAEKNLFSLDATTTNQPHFTKRCSDGEVKFEGSYTVSRRTAPEPSMQSVDAPYDYNTTAYPHRTVELRSRVPVNEGAKRDGYGRGKLLSRSL
jgi:hypothetical protein